MSELTEYLYPSEWIQSKGSMNVVEDFMEITVFLNTLNIMGVGWV
jgi:hypothetical protein